MESIRFLGTFASAVSFLALVVYQVAIRRRGKHKNTPDVGVARFASAWTLLRFVVAVVTLGLSVASATAKDHISLADISICASISYASVLLLLSAYPSREAHLRSAHATLVLLATLLPFLYRDVWALCTLTLRPEDEAEGQVLWWKIGLLAGAGVVIPLVTPTSQPSDGQNPEATASALSTAFYFFMDDTVRKAQRAKQVTAVDLPTLLEADTTAFLAAHAREHLDQTNLLWSLLRMFHRTLGLQLALGLANSLASFMNPIGVNRLLKYLEADGKGAVIHLWVWIAFATGGPFLAWTLHHLSRFLSSKMFVRIGSIITEQVFEQALRLRLVPSDAEGASRPAKGASPDVTGTDPALLDVPRAPELDVSGAAGAAATQQDHQTPEKLASNIQGKINNLVTSDLANVMNGEEAICSLVTIPVNAAFAVTLLYLILGWSSLVGLAVMVILFPVPSKLASLMGGFEAKRMEAADARVQAITETLSVLRMIKLFALEQKAQEDLAKKRTEELKYIRWSKLMQLCNNLLNHTIPLVHMVVTFAIYTLVMKRELTASTVFSAIISFDLLRWQIFTMFATLPQLIQARISIRRVQDFLNSRPVDLVDESARNFPAPQEHVTSIGFGPGYFSWAAPSHSCNGPRKTFQLEINEELIFKPSVLNLIIGPTASGKTSLLHALLGEMHHIRTRPGCWVNLPRENGVAYAAQEPWVISGTVKENIIFGSMHNEQRYRQVLHQCGLEQDLSLWQAGDATEVGEKGVTLSGGQKARISLARAVYSVAAIVLLDDVLAALDIHTAKWVVEKCFNGSLMRDRTVILVTHNVALTMKIAQFAVSLRDGRVHSQGPTNLVLSNEVYISQEIAKQQQVVQPETNKENGPATTADGHLVLEEEKSEGRVSFTSFRIFLDLVGGSVPTVFWALYLFGAVGALAALTLEPWWLGIWANQYSKASSTRVNVTYYLAVYSAIVGVSLVTHALAVIVWTLGSIRASRSIHARLLSSIFSSTFRWLDSTPVSRIIARCTSDIQSFDSGIPMNVNWFVDAVIGLGLRITFIVPFAPLFLPFGILILIVGVIVGNIYMKAQIAVRRELAVAKAPVLHVMSGAMSGLASVRAYGCQDMFRQQLHMQNDHYVTCARTYNNLSRWVGTRMSLVGTTFTTGLAIYLIYGGNRPNPSNIGFLLNTATMFGEYILWAVQVWNGLEVEGNSLERLQEYLNIEQELKPTDSGTPPAYWPSSGELRVNNLSARYSYDGPKVLKNISFNVRSGERIGIVGRTGSGKSSLTLALLRAIPTSGDVHYDDIDTSRINLDALRSSISIIPQAPELVVGTLRQNLDPFGQHDDKVLYDALTSAGLHGLQSTTGERSVRLALDTEVAASGKNLSLGQRQIVALARAMVRASKILILDEATSAIDYDTDAAIQRSLRHELGKDVTVLVVAHRVQSVMDSDKIMVLEAGQLVEFASPMELLRKEDGRFRKLVDESEDREALLSMVDI